MAKILDIPDYTEEVKEAIAEDIKNTKSFDTFFRERLEFYYFLYVNTVTPLTFNEFCLEIVNSKNSRKEDFLGKIPEIGDMIVFNPPGYKGLINAECIGFTKAGLPKCVNFSEEFHAIQSSIKSKGFYTPKTDFIALKKEDYA